MQEIKGKQSYRQATPQYNGRALGECMSINCTIYNLQFPKSTVKMTSSILFQSFVFFKTVNSEAGSLQRVIPQNCFPFSKTD